MSSRTNAFLIIGFVLSLAASVSFGQTVYSSIDQKTGWQSCGACAGPGGAGPDSPHSMKQNVASPSMDGHSASFSLGGTTPLSAALWWKQLGANGSAKHFVYDLWFYLKNPAAAQALEFDVNQTVGSKMFVFGTQCNIKGTHTWDVWDYYKRWVSTGIGCSAPSAYKWHHLAWEFERTATNKMNFIAVTLDGKKSYVNRAYNPKPASTPQLNVAFQMDGSKTMTDYTVWLDKVTLNAW